MNKLAYTIPEAAAASGVSVSTVKRLLSRREIPPVKIGHRTVIRAEDLKSFIDRGVII
jgi:excisionase family DNA binding protein